MKILIVDDSKTSLLLTSKQLEMLGHTTVSISDPEKAIEEYKSCQPDLIILDVVMDKLSGYECAKLITDYNKEKDDWVPIIFLSAIVDDTAIEQGINAGGDDYLTKPFNTSVLKAKIHAMSRIAEMRNKLLETNDKLEELSLTDTLTKLANRSHFEKMMTIITANAKRTNKMFALLFIDLDKFKDVNDTLGHHAGDDLLIQACKRIQNEVREADFIARLGGDEFAVILPEIDTADNAGHVANKIVKSLCLPFDILNNDVIISASIGIACFPDAGTDTETITKHADIAMYRAKAIGRNTYQYFTPELNAAHASKIEMEQALAKALDNEEFFLSLQPKYQLEPRELTGFEVLLRWNNPKYGAISPDNFIPLAEETGLINNIGDWVIEHACATLAEFQSHRKSNLTFAINISPIQITGSNLFKMFQDCMKKFNLQANQIELELTETAIMTYSKVTENALKQLHDIGMRIAIDDFGTGFSSLSHIKRLPIDGLKIDKDFVIDILTDENDAAIVKSIILLAKSLGLNIIAEGIETQEQLDFLLKNGCNHGQGFFFFKPLSIEDAKDLLK